MREVRELKPGEEYVYTVEIALKGGHTLEADFTEFTFNRRGGTRSLSWKSAHADERLVHVDVDEIAAVKQTRVEIRKVPL